MIPWNSVTVHMKSPYMLTLCIFFLFVCHFTLLRNHENDLNPAPGFSHFLCITWHVNMKYAWSDFLFIAIPVIQNKKILHYCHYWSLVSIVFEEHHNMSPKGCAPVLVGLAVCLLGEISRQDIRGSLWEKEIAVFIKKKNWNGSWCFIFCFMFYCIPDY